MKDFRQTGGFHPSGPRQHFVNPQTTPKFARPQIGDKHRREMERLRKEAQDFDYSKVSPQEMARRRDVFERLGYWNTAIPAALATPEIVDQMGELDEYGEVLRMLEQMQPQGE